MTHGSDTGSLVKWLHLLGIVFWIGGLFVTTLVLVPALGAFPPPDRGKVMEAFAKRFSPMVWVAVILTVVTGVIMANRIGLGVVFSFSSAYGRIMLLKHLLTLIQIVVGAYTGFFLIRKMASFRLSASASAPSSGRLAEGPAPELVALQRRFTMLSRLLVVNGAAILFLMGLLG